AAPRSSAQVPQSGERASSDASLTLRWMTAVGDDYDLHIFGERGDLLYHARVEERQPFARRRTGQKNLGNFVSTSEIHELGRGGVAFKNSRFNVQIPRELQMTIDGFSFGFGQICEIACFLDSQSEALGVEKVAHTLSAANQHGSLRICGYVHENPAMMALVFR